MSEPKVFDVMRVLRMMRLARPHGSDGELQFIKEFIDPLKPMIHADEDGSALAFVVEVVGKDGKLPPILFSSHVDTVHAANDPTVQEVIYDEECGFAYKDDSRPLGADNAAGCALLIHMIEAGVPGAYIFHRGEERGGIGSSGMANYHEAWLKQFKWAIAFDRRGLDSVITEMFAGETASDRFATALAAVLNNDTDFKYKADPTGSFTDTANYAHLIPECTNVSVGYDNEHTGNETLDMWHLQKLAARMVEAFKDGPEKLALPVVREAAEPVSKYWKGWRTTGFTAGVSNSSNSLDPRDAYDVTSMGYKEVVDFVRASPPQDVADLLFDLAERVQELEEALDEGGDRQENEFQTMQRMAGGWEDDEEETRWK